MPLGTYIAGKYGVTYAGTGIGQSTRGFELAFQFKGEVLDESDAYGLTMTDWIYRGCDVSMTAALKEYKAGSLAVLWPVGGGTLGRIATAAVPIGVLASDMAQALVMTSTASTPAATSPASLTASKAWISPTYNPRILFDSRLREVPIQLVFLPSDSAGTVTAFTTT